MCHVSLLHAVQGGAKLYHWAVESKIFHYTLNCIAYTFIKCFLDFFKFIHCKTASAHNLVNLSLKILSDQKLDDTSPLWCIHTHAALG